MATWLMADALLAVLVLGVGVWLGRRTRALQLDVRDLLLGSTTSARIRAAARQRSPPRLTGRLRYLAQLAAAARHFGRLPVTMDAASYAAWRYGPSNLAHRRYPGLPPTFRTVLHIPPRQQTEPTAALNDPTFARWMGTVLGT